ncbi:hypothetical protein Ancab_001630, partial [Ancistrocladus abbreviatus]
LPNSEMVDGCKPNREMEVGWTWVHSITGDFSAQSAFDFLLAHRHLLLTSSYWNRVGWFSRGG